MDTHDCAESHDCSAHDICQVCMEMTAISEEVLAEILQEERAANAEALRLHQKACMEIVSQIVEEMRAEDRAYKDVREVQRRRMLVNYIPYRPRWMKSP